MGRTSDSASDSLKTLIEMELALRIRDKFDGTLWDSCTAKTENEWQGEPSPVGQLACGWTPTQSTCTPISRGRVMGGVCGRVVTTATIGSSSGQLRATRNMRRQPDVPYTYTSAKRVE